MMRPTIVLAVLAIFTVSSAHAAEKLTYVDLVNRIIDLERVATLPAEGETTAQASSYDRRSRYDEKTDKYIDWHVNGDGAIPPTTGDGRQFLLAELKGPGVIWRMWSAMGGKGRVRVYLDGAETPAIDLPFEEYFTGQHAPFNRPAMVYTAARGQNSYVPISYQKSCRIVADPEWGRYYQFTYTTYPEGTQLPTFKRELSTEENAALDRVNEFFTNKLGTDPAGQRKDAKTETTEVIIEAGSKAGVLSLDGSRAITAIRMELLDLPNRAEQIAALRELGFSIKWDGSDKPAVWTPLGDFFGSAVGINPYKSLNTGMSENGSAYALWYMPFERGAQIELSNDGPSARKVSFEITHAPLTRPASDFGRFHAKWHRDVNVPARADRWPDWTVLETQGRGRFCGMMLHVWTPTPGPSRQFGRDGNHWWGEGDEKFFVDGEKFPSTFGTGTEDYFGYAWCNPALFEKAFHGQTLSQNNRGHQVVHRWQIADAIGFQKSFDGYLEKYYPNDWPTLYAAVACWYLDPKGVDPYDAVSVAERTGYYPLNPAYEGENLKVQEVTGGKTEVQELLKNAGMGQTMFMGGKQLWWQGGNVGDKLTVAVPVTSAGKYAARVGMCRSFDYATAQIEFAGRRPLGPIDFYNKTAEPVEIYLGEFELQRGETPLTIEITGKHPEAQAGNMAGIDYVMLAPIKPRAQAISQSGD